ncbi:recombinase family protein [Aliiroseovarius sp. S1339]|uniref:recombinase family protein n=1 Tax=Aliiroseovarius sp. S1339 TaxID=2936990 RepID=UPI0020C0756C|nr:recombinase family protein [Aliiroseovarius sp. S1339]MCK8464452.1 recombinase family protein [Aliiroseovarius sp. S1339]
MAIYGPPFPNYRDGPLQRGRLTLDRLSRDQEHIAALHKRMRFLGVDIVTKAEGEINEMHIGLGGTMNALFLKNLAQKTHRGLEGRVVAGKSGGGRSYG